MPDRPDTSDRLRHEIDHGRSGDKVNFSDPAAAPLGTDDEAAGSPPTEQQIRMARDDEVLARHDSVDADRTDRTIPSRLTGGTSLGYWTAAIVLLVLIGLAFGVLGA